MDLPPPRPWEPRYDLNGIEVLADWNCPVCGISTPKTRRPGRPSVYCSNACRQRAYRYRMRNGIRLLRGDGRLTARAKGVNVQHLLRPSDDPVAEVRRLHDRKAVSLCGAFVRPAADHPDLVTDFVFDDAAAFYSCLGLTGSPRPDPPMVYSWESGRKSYQHVPIVKRPVTPGYAASIRRAPMPWRRGTRTRR